ncbi:MAG TPA: adenylyl-sulfate kinase [Candidatus Lustribacter sp.]
MRDLRVAVTGHVDHGKSTLIGRLLHDTGSLVEGKADEIIASSRRRGLAVEWSFAVDAAQEERDQAITIETARVWLHYGGRRIVIIDTPGHREFIKNMMSGAADADVGILVIDALEGIADQTYRHAYLLRLLDVPEIVVAVNKIDAVPDARERFAQISSDIRAVLETLGRPLRAIVPLSARDGDNVVTRSERTSWYAGPALIEVLVALHPAAPPAERAVRFDVADVYRFNDDERIAVGNVVAGSIAPGDRVRLSPSGATTRVRAIRRWPDDPSPGRAGQAVGLTFEDPVFIDRGDVVTAAEQPPLGATASFDGVFFWLSATPPRVGETLPLKIGRAEVAVTIAGIDETIDLGILDKVAPDDSSRHTAFALRLRAARGIAADVGARCVLLRGGEVVGGGKLSRVEPPSARRSDNLVLQGHLISSDSRAQRNGYRGLVAWLTGLPGSGKSTIAMAVERELFARGYFVYVLDGDNVRAGLNRDLGFTTAGRQENIRRIGEVAALFADAGAIVIASTISPSAAARAAARASAPGAFHEIYVRASVATCEARDVKGHYAQARAGTLPDFTGVSAPYEEPERPDLLVDTNTATVEDSVARVLEHLIRHAAKGALLTVPA